MKKEGEGEGKDGRKRFQTNPWILKTAYTWPFMAECFEAVMRCQRIPVKKRLLDTPEERIRCVCYRL